MKLLERLFRTRRARDEESRNNTRKIIYFYCLEYGFDSLLLSVTADWVRELQSRGYVIRVITIKLTGQPLYGNFVYELGGGTIGKKFRAVWRMSYILCQILREKKPVTVFYHMNHKALAFQGLILEIFGIHQTLWYSHAKKDSYLRIAKQFADLIITTGDEAFPLNHKNVLKVGQAVSSHKFHFTKELNFHDKRKMSILSVGRIGQAKNLEKLICSDFDLRDMKDFSIVLVGPKTDPAYVNQLSTFAKLRGIDISFHSSIRNEELSTLYRDYDFYFTGTEKAIDKSAAEAAMCGLVVISDNNSLLKLLCLDAKSLSVANSNWAIKDQIEFYANLSGERLWRLQEQTSEIAKHVFSLENVIEKYLEVYSAVNITKNYP